MQIKKLVPLVLFGALLVYAALTVAAPHAAFADDNVKRGLDRLSPTFGSSGSFFNTDNVFELITRIIKMLLGFSGIIAVLFVIIGGFQYMTSAGNSEQAEKGRATLINAIIGIVIIVLSYVIINVIVNTVQCSTSGVGSWLGGC